MRWFDDLAVLVTYRRKDPLYAVNLTDTAHPRLLGKARRPRLLLLPAPAREPGG
ncbi:beta-propeller domain-containing protein [Nocardioides convexus]|uniref:beta-propeller domain-containing protein n=1 Tax=Nocardioides convexus TaxID=2712224 RepID=UPI0024187A2E|nr:beta-propeller domain-containing protein [Nocardioides convexus]